MYYLKHSDVFILLISAKMPTIVGILSFMGRINSMLSRFEHEKKFYTYNLEAWSLTTSAMSILEMGVLRIQRRLWCWSARSSVTDETFICISRLTF